MQEKEFFEFKRPCDNHKRRFLTYISNDSNGDERMWIEIAPHRRSSITSLVTNIRKRPEINLVKRVHRYTHGNSKELIDLFTEAGMMTKKIRKAIDKVVSSCNIRNAPATGDPRTQENSR